MADQQFVYPPSLPHAARVSVPNGSATATFTGAALQGLPLAGATLLITPDGAARYQVGVIANIDGEYADDEILLTTPWNGTTISDAKFEIVYGPGLYKPSELTSIQARLRNQMQQGAGLVYRTETIIDPTLIPPQSVKWDPDTKTLYQWVDGVWEILDIARLGTARGSWKGLSPKHTLTISTGDVAVDLDDGPNYELPFDDDFELQLPTNVEQGDSFDILFTADGGGDTPSFASGYTGEAASVIRTDDGARTRLTFIVTAETGGTATAVTVAKVTYEADDIVEDGGFVFISNIAANFSEPPFTDPSTPSSDASWTWLPIQKGDPGSALLTATSNSSVALGAGTKTFMLAENAERGFGIGAVILAADSANPATNYCRGTVLSYDHPELQLSVPADEVVGSGTISSWVISLSGPRGREGTQPGLAYEFDTTTSAGADPGTMRANNADLSAATHLYFADDDLAGIDQSAFLVQVGDSTSTTKGHVHVKRVADGTQTIFRIDAAASDETGYVDVTVTYVSGPTSVADESLVSVEFKDRGDAGSGASAFTDLDDTPASLSGQGDKIVKVNSGGTALEFGVVLGDAAAKNTGSTAGTVAAGDDSRFTNAASTSAVGHVELADVSETSTGTDTGRAVTPDGLAGSIFGESIVSILVFDDSQDVVTGDGAGDIFWRVPQSLNGMNLVRVAAQVQTAGTTGTTDIQIARKRLGGSFVDTLSTKITIDSAEVDTSTAATPAVIDTSNDDVQTGDQFRFDVDAVSTTKPKGLIVELTFRLP